MAVLVLKDAYALINAVDLSDHIRSITINYEAEIQDKTVMGATGRGKIAGLTNASIDITFAQDYAAGEVDATLHPLIGAAAFAFIIKPNGSSTGVTNPRFYGNAVLASYNPISGSVGDFAEAQATFEVDGTLSRATSD